MPANNLCLVFDNNPEHQELTALVLSDLGLEVETVEITACSFDLVLERQPSIVVVDLQVRLEDSWVLLEQLHLSAEARRIPVVCLSTDQDQLEQARRECSFPGGARFLQKPFDIQDLEAAVLELLPFLSRSARQHSSSTPTSS